MKKVVVVVKIPEVVGVEQKQIEKTQQVLFETKLDYLTVHNTDDGLLIVNDVKRGVSPVNLGAFNKDEWIYWIVSLRGKET